MISMCIGWGVAGRAQIGFVGPATIPVRFRGRLLRGGAADPIVYKITFMRIMTLQP